MAAAASCSAVDVIGILHKMRQDVAAYRIEVEWERGPVDVYPRPVISMTVRHIVSGMEIDPAAVEKAVRLSDEKYCGILATLRQPPEIKTEFAVELPGAIRSSNQRAQASLVRVPLASTFPPAVISVIALLIDSNPASERLMSLAAMA